jgi:hypothetical protein
MKKAKPFLILFIALTMITTMTASVFAAQGKKAAAKSAKPEDVFVVGDGDWVLKSGDEPPEGRRGASLEQNIYWYAVDPENDKAAKSLERGILLYDGNAKKYSFLPTDEEQTRVENITFSPNGKRMVLACILNRFASGLWVYETESLKPEKSFWGYSDVFFMDDDRFAFTLKDRNVERPEAAGMWGTSAAIYDVAADEGYVILKGATKTENFTVSGFANESGDEISVIVTSVKSEKDWEDIYKQTDTEITVKVPAAG